MEPVIISKAASTNGSNTGTALLAALATVTLIGVAGLAIYDYTTHSKQWFWHRFRDENDLRKREGVSKKPVFQQIKGLFADISESW